LTTYSSRSANVFPAHELEFAVAFPGVDDRKYFEYPRSVLHAHSGNDGGNVSNVDPVRDVGLRRLRGEILPPRHRLYRRLNGGVRRPRFDDGAVGIPSFGDLLYRYTMPQLADF